MRYQRLLMFVVCVFAGALVLFAGGGQEEVVPEAERQGATLAESDAWRSLELGFYELDEFERLSGMRIDTFTDSPILDARVAAGDLPPVADRLPENPLVQIPWDEIGEFGGTLRYSVTGGDLYQRYLNTAYLIRIPPQDIIHRTSGPRIGRRTPDILEQWDMNSDGTIHTMTIRRGLRWSDGAPVTTEDVRFHVYDRLLNPDVTPAPPEWLRWGEPTSEVTTEVEIVDRYTFNIVFSEPNPAFNFNYGRNEEYWAEILSPSHYLKQFHRDYADWDSLLPLMEERGFTEQNEWGRFFLAMNPNMYDSATRIGMEHALEYPVLDPYVPIEIRPDGEWTFERNPYFHVVDPAGNQLPYIDRLRRRQRSEQEAINLDIISGSTDIQGWYTNIADFPIYKENETSGNYFADLIPYPHDHLLIYAFNMAHADPQRAELFSDVRFRRAMSIALDRENMQEQIFLGTGEPRNFTPDPRSPYYIDDLSNEFSQYNPERARELLDDIGLIDRNGDGWRQFPDGSTFTLNIEYFLVSPASVPGAEFAQRYWEDVGVRVNAQLIDSGFWSQTQNAGEIDTYIWWGHGPNPADTSWMGLGIPARTWRIWHTTNGASGTEPPQWAQDYLALHSGLLRTIDMDEWIENGQEIFRQVNDQLPFIGTVSGAGVPLIVSNDLGNLNVSDALDRDFTMSTIMDYSWQLYFSNPARRQD